MLCSLHRSRRALLAVLAVGSSGVIASLALGACTDASTIDLFTPITGVIVRASEVTQSLGCGDGENQVYKYGAIVVEPEHQDADGGVVPTKAHGAALYNCYSDAQFVGLPGTATDNVEFHVEILALNKAAFEAQSAKVDMRDLIPGPNAKPEEEHERIRKAEVERVQSLQPTWSTDCEAVQQRDVRVLAKCDVLSLGVKGLKDRPEVYNRDVEASAIRIDLGNFTAADGKRVKCDDNFYARASIRARTTPKGAQLAGLEELVGLDQPCGKVTPPPPCPASDAGADAGAGADAEAGDASTCVTEPTVETFFFVARPAYSPATYSIDVELKNALNVTAFTTRCTAATSPNVVTDARCEPVRAVP